MFRCGGVLSFVWHRKIKGIKVALVLYGPAMADGVLSTLNNNDFWCLDTMLGDCEVYCWPGEAIDRHLAMIVAVSIIYY